MPSSSAGSDDSPAKDSIASGSTAGSGARFKKKSFNLMKKLGKKSTKHNVPQPQVEVPSHHLQQINEISPPSSPPLSPPQKTVSEDGLETPQDPPKVQSVVKKSSFMESVSSPRTRGDGVEVELSYTSGESSSPDKLGNADNAFLQALRGSTSMDEDADEQNNISMDQVSDKSSLKGGMSEADNSFLSAFHGEDTGGNDSGSKKSSVTGVGGSSSQQSAADTSFLRAFRGAASSSSGQLRTGSSGRMSKAATGATASAGGSSLGSTTNNNGESEADNAFLRAFHGDSGESANAGSSTRMPSTDGPPGDRSDADNAFLSAFRGESSNPSSTLTRDPRQGYPKQQQASKAVAPGGLSNADTDFLAAMRGTPPPPPPSAEPAGGSPSISSIGDSSLSGQRTSRQQTHQHLKSRDMPLPSISNSKDLNDGPKDEMSHANAAFLGALHAPSGPAEDERGTNRAQSYADGSFINNTVPQKKPSRVAPPVSRAKPQQQHTNNTPSLQSDSDNDFLKAMRGQVSVDSQSSSSFNPASFDTGGYDSGTLVLNPPNATTKGGRSTTDSSSDFMMAIHASTEDDNINAVTGERDSEEEKKDSSEPEALEEEEEESDEDIEGIKIPQHPYMEKVMLPRPLFFGHKLPVRVMKEADRAASLYATTVNDTELENVRENQPDSIPHVDTESTAGDDGSVVSRSSISSFGASGGKRFESNVPRCCRNLEGAIEVFGFGVNPFNNVLPIVVDDHGTEENEEPTAPHPYVSIYSPVWDAWARTARAKRRKKLGKAISKAEAAKPKPLAPISHLLPPSTIGRRRGHKTSVSMDFLDSLRGSMADPPVATNVVVEKSASSKPPSSSPVNTTDTSISSFSSLATTDTAAPTTASNNSDLSQDAFLRYARGEAADELAPAPAAESTDLSQDAFLRYARGEAADETTPTPAPAPESTDLSQDAFLRYARGEAADEPAPAPAPESTDLSQDAFLRYARGEAADEPAPAPASESTDLSQDAFLRYARAGTVDDSERNGTFVGTKFSSSVANTNDNGTFVAQPPKKNAFPIPAFDCSTFVQAVKSSDGGSDDDSIEAAEERTAVGLNDNISAAAAMLAGSGGVDIDDGDDVNGGIWASMSIAVGGGAKAGNVNGRPYSNFELTRGCIPQFPCDDPSLPHESDLGVFETKEEEKRSAERRRERNMIEDFAVPGIMPHVACPTQCSDADDSVSWTSRFTENDLGGATARTGSNTMLISLDSNTPANQPGKDGQQPKSQLYEASRIAWWNLPDDFDEASTSRSKKHRPKGAKSQRPTAEVFPALDDPIPLDVQTNLWPPVGLLRENNMSGTRSHPATSTARFMPHISDRAPSVRHLQIDTTAVGFPKLGGEVEPMFCKLAIYHFEMSTEKSAVAASSNPRDGDSVSTTASSYAPSPNMQRCGKVTESLSFDVVQDQQVIENCKRALWPYAEQKPDGTDAPATFAFDGIGKDIQSEGTPCGIFPLPSNLSISNLYAVIIVHKVIAEDADVQHYYKPGRHESTHGDIPDLANLRDSAKTASEQYGQYTIPFAFGVVPLKHIIGDESPKLPVSRAVQIPLFKFDTDRGPQSIFDHILLMLHPR